MGKNIVTKEGGLSVEIIRGYSEPPSDKYIGILGGDSRNLSWQEYLDEVKDEFKPHVLLVKKAIEENGMIGYKGHDTNDLYFKFSDGYVFGYTWRGWGDLMQSIVNKREGYIAYYI
mgnify:CR=1 FL=1